MLTTLCGSLSRWRLLSALDQPCRRLSPELARALAYSPVHTGLSVFHHRHEGDDAQALPTENASARHHAL